MYQDASALGLQTDFSADLVLKPSPIKELGPGDEVNVSGSSIMTCAGKTFGSLRVGDIIIVNLNADPDPRFNRVSAISSDLKSVTLAAVQDVSGVCEGAAVGTDTLLGVKVGKPAIKNQNVGLFAELQEKNISDVDLTDSILTIKSQITGETTDANGLLSFNLSNVFATELDDDVP